MISGMSAMASPLRFYASQRREGTTSLVDVADIPRIVSVDDHVIEPAHLFERWLPARYRDLDPKSQRKGIAKTTLHGGSDYRFELADDAPLTDMSGFEDLSVPLLKNIAATGF